MTILEPELEVFKELAKVEFGLNFYNKNEHLLLKAINTRIKVHGLESQRHYYRKLQGNHDELKELVSLLTNNETYFYREPKQLEFLCEFLVPKIQADNPVGRPIRILSIGCSIGAEPYSIAMVLHQKFGAAAAKMFTILGGDVDGKALEKARVGRYRSMEFRAISPQLQQRYFIQDKSSGFILDPEIRQMVSLHYMNIVSNTIAPELRNMDIIFFRNVSIYFDPATRLVIQKKIASLLKNQGYLIVGMTESMSNDFGFLKLKHEGNIFYFAKEKANGIVKTTGKSVKAGLEIPVQKSQTVKSSLNHYKSSDLNVNRRSYQKTITTNQNNESANLVDKKDYEKAIQILDTLPGDSHSTLKNFLLQSFILFNRQDFEHSRDYALRALDMAPFTVDGFLLLGMISKWQDHLQDAIDWFKKALYIHTDCWPAHYYLAGLYRQTKHSKKAQQEYQLVLQQLDKPGENYTNRLVIPLSFRRADIQLLCRSHLHKLSADANLYINHEEKRHGH